MVRSGGRAWSSVLDKYIGYTAELYSPLSPAECVRRLREDFTTPHPRIPRETRSDPLLSGRVFGSRFTITHNRQWLEEGLKGNNPFYRTRTFRGDMMPWRGGTRIRGTYGYGLQALFWDASTLAAFCAIGVSFFVIGLINVLANPELLVPTIVLLVGVGVTGYFLRGLRALRPAPQGRDVDLIAEKDHIVRYLSAMLDVHWETT